LTLDLPASAPPTDPYAAVESRGTFHGWLCERREEMETELPRLFGVDPI